MEIMTRADDDIPAVSSLAHPLLTPHKGILKGDFVPPNLNCSTENKNVFEICY